MRSLCCILCCFGLAPTDQASGQSFASDTSFVAEARRNTIKRYTAEVGVNSNFYNGAEYSEYSPQSIEHPYLEPDWKMGSVVYGREVYENVPLLFDLSHDQLITSYEHGSAIRLVKDKVESFTIEGDRFTKINDSQVPQGFYEVVYDHKTSFLVRREKALQVTLEGNVTTKSFSLREIHYLVKGGKFHTIRGEKSLLKALGDHRQELKKLIRESKIRYRMNKEKAAFAILQLYDQLTP